MSVLYFTVTEMIFGKYAGLKPFDWVGERVGDLAWHASELCRRWWHRYRRREPVAEQEGETPAGGKDRRDGPLRDFPELPPPDQR